MPSDNRKMLHVELGPVQIDVPQTVGYFCGIGAAVALGLLEPPLAAFIAAVPLIKILADPGSPAPVRFVAEILQGAAKPVGSDAEGTVRLAKPPRVPRKMAGLEAAAQRAPAKQAPADAAAPRKATSAAVRD
jgi:hypothetical protein